MTVAEIVKIIAQLDKEYFDAEDDDLCEALSAAVESLKDAKDRIVALEQQEEQARDDYGDRVDNAYDKWLEGQAA